MRFKIELTTILFILLAAAGLAFGQTADGPAASRQRANPDAASPPLVMGPSSSLYLADTPASEPLPAAGGRVNRMSPSIARASLLTVHLPEPRVFAMHDLVTIIIRESTESDASHELETSKEYELDGGIRDFPSLQLKDLLQMQLRPSSASEDSPRVGIELENEFEGEGEYRRRDSFTTRITARIIDIKPNGTLVLEARKYIQNDDETLMMRLTGACRKDDVTAQNTILSTQMSDMHLVKQTAGELRRANRKGILTNVFDTIFNF